MAKKTHVVVDGNEAAAYVAYRINEINIIYPITPASLMGEIADECSGKTITNIWGTVPHTIEMQSEGGAAGAIHGALQTGALATTYTSSQGLLLMIPNMYRIAAELTPTVFHVASRILAYQGMSIYCDHSDVYAARSTGFAMFCSNNVQEAHDFALLAQAASLKSRVPFLHFFDGFRTSHEESKIELLSDEIMRQMLDEEFIIAHRNRKLSPNNPFVRDAVQNQDIVFQARESSNLFYDSIEPTLNEYMRRFEKLTGRSYNLLDYYGAKDADRIIIIMGSGAETIEETISYLNKKGEKLGLIKVHLFRPFPKESLLKILPPTCKAIAVLDRTKESGAAGEPLFEEVATTLLEAYNDSKLPMQSLPKVVSGRYGIGSKEFTPAMVKSIFDELKKSAPKNHFTIGINDDVTHTNLSYDRNLDIEPDHVIRAIFYGLGADGTVGANKNTVKIIGEETDKYVQAYFVYSANKSGARTISHLRFSQEPIKSTYLIQSANFIGCHHHTFINKVNILEKAANNAIFLLNTPHSKDTVWQHLPKIAQQQIIAKKIKFYVIDASKVAAETKMGDRINTIMQTCFFALSNVLPKDAAIQKIKETIEKTYIKKGRDVIEQNYLAVDMTLANLFEVTVPNFSESTIELVKPDITKAPEMMREMIDKMSTDLGDELPVSAVPPDGTYPIGTTCLEKRNLGMLAAIWDENTCIQCGQCNMVCPHSALRVKQYHQDHLRGAPETFKSATSRDKNYPEHKYSRQVYTEDCTACGLCENVCPLKTKAIKLQPKPHSLDAERANIDFFEKLPSIDIEHAQVNTVRDAQHLQPFFEFCSACAGCGEAPYVRLLSQLYGDRLLIADACGCTLVYGGTLPTMAWTKDENGRGPAYSGSLFEDNAEFGFGYALTADKHCEFALELLEKMRSILDDELVNSLKNANLNSRSEIERQRKRIEEVKIKLANNTSSDAIHLVSVIDYLIRPSIWAVGGDGWAYDIGYGGLDHVIANNRKINILVLDTEVYSNTGGQASKATPRGSVAKFAAQGKSTAKKDLGLMAMTYGSAYIASIALGANPNQAIKAFKEAEKYPGPALIIAYSHCIAHGIDMQNGMQQQRLAVKSGYWPLYRYNPLLKQQGLNPLQLDCDAPSIPLKDYMYNENRFRSLLQQNPGSAAKLLELAEADVNARWEKLGKSAK